MHKQYQRNEDTCKRASKSRRTHTLTISRIRFHSSSHTSVQIAFWWGNDDVYWLSLVHTMWAYTRTHSHQSNKKGGAWNIFRDDFFSLVAFFVRIIAVCSCNHCRIYPTNHNVECIFRMCVCMCIFLCVYTTELNPQNHSIILDVCILCVNCSFYWWDIVWLHIWSI